MGSDTAADTRPTVLVIKLSSLGDVVLAMGAFRTIREYHRDARIVLLTTRPYVALAEACGYFDEVWIDSRPKFWQPGAWLALGRRLRGGGFTRVYDLQTSDRTNTYYRLFGRRKPEWSGVARGCSHPHDTPARTRVHTVDRLIEQLTLAGIPEVRDIDLSWATADLGEFGVDAPYALLVPGGSAHRPEKRWPAANYAALASHLSKTGVRPVLIGAGAERDVLAEIAGACPAALDLCDRTGFEAIIALARGARVAVGNDTGPMHLIAPTGCPSITLFSNASNPVRSRPWGARVTVIRRDPLDDLTCEEVIASLPPAD